MPREWPRDCNETRGNGGAAKIRKTNFSAPHSRETFPPKGFWKSLPNPPYISNEYLFPVHFLRPPTRTLLVLSARTHLHPRCFALRRVPCLAHRPDGSARTAYAVRTKQAHKVDRINGRYLVSRSTTSAIIPAHAPLIGRDTMRGVQKSWRGPLHWGLGRAVGSGACKRMRGSGGSEKRLLSLRSVHAAADAMETVIEGAMITSADSVEEDQSGGDNKENDSVDEVVGSKRGRKHTPWSARSRGGNRGR